MEADSGSVLQVGSMYLESNSVLAVQWPLLGLCDRRPPAMITKVLITQLGTSDPFLGALRAVAPSRCSTPYMEGQEGPQVTIT